MPLVVIFVASCFITTVTNRYEVIASAKLKAGRFARVTKVMYDDAGARHEFITKLENLAT